MKPKFVPLMILLSIIGLGTAQFAIAGSPAGKATGDVVVINQGRWHSFAFAALQSGPATLGKGFLAHHRLSSDGTAPIRHEICLIAYVSVAGEDAWFAGPILYDSLDPAPTRWFVLQVHDGGQPGAGHDALWWTRIANGEIALDMVESMATPPAPGEVVRGNLKVHTY